MSYFLWLAIFFWLPIGIISLFSSSYLKHHWQLLILAPIFAYIAYLPVEHIVLRKVLVMHPGHYSGIWIDGIVFEDFLFFVSYPVLLTIIVLLIKRTGRRQYGP